jgi:predicted nucleotidyltransferase
LLTQIQDEELLKAINELLARKKSGVELGLEPKIEPINNFLEKELAHLEEVVKSFDPKIKPKQHVLEDGFIKILEYLEEEAIFN